MTFLANSIIILFCFENVHTAHTDLSIDDHTIPTVLLQYGEINLGVFAFSVVVPLSLIVLPF